jgi:hypothetical protein
VIVFLDRAEDIIEFVGTIHHHGVTAPETGVQLLGSWRERNDLYRRSR